MNLVWFGHNCSFIAFISSLFTLLIYLLGFGKLTQHFLPQDEGPHWPKVTCPWQVNSNVKSKFRSTRQVVALSQHRMVALSSHPVLDWPQRGMRWEWGYESGQLEHHSGNTDSETWAQVSGQNSIFNHDRKHMWASCIFPLSNSSFTHLKCGI